MIISKPIRVAIIEDHSLYRAGLKALFETETDLEIVGEAVDRRSSFEIVIREKPDLLIVDIQLGRDSCLNFIEELVAMSGARAILLTASANEEEIHFAIQAGVMGLVFKDEGGEVLIRAIRAVLRGESWLSRPLLSAALERARLNRQRKERNPDQLKLDSLTSREREVVALMASGLNRQRVAEKLCIADGTVRNHLTAIFGKLDVQNQMDLVFYAQKNGLDKPAGSTFSERTFSPEEIPRFSGRGAS